MKRAKNREARPPAQETPFWETKSLERMSREEWESLCDGCGLCCLHKLEIEETGEIFESNYTCPLLDKETCRCSDYENRDKRIKNCRILTPDIVKTLSWLPETCAYRLLDEGKDLPHWHPLKTGRAESVHEAGISVSSRQVTPLTQLEDLVQEATDFYHSNKFRRIKPRQLP